MIHIWKLRDAYFCIIFKSIIINQIINQILVHTTYVVVAKQKKVVRNLLSFAKISEYIDNGR